MSIASKLPEPVHPARSIAAHAAVAIAAMIDFFIDCNPPYAFVLLY
jgi:hypothetical protein